MYNVETSNVVSQNDYSSGNAITTIGYCSTAPQVNSNTKKWAEIVQHISNTHKEFSNDKWDVLFSHLQTVANTDCSSFFTHDKKLSNDIRLLQENLRTIISILDKASVLHETKTSLKALQLELDTEITKIKNSVNKLYEPHGGNKLIYNKRSKESNASKLFNATLILSVASIVLSVALFALPLVFPALAAGATVLIILRGVSTLFSCVSGFFAIYEGVKKGDYKLTKSQEREFTETLSALHNYLNKLNIPDTTDESIKSSMLLIVNNAPSQDNDKSTQLDRQQLLKVTEIQTLFKIILQLNNNLHPDILVNAYSA